MNNKLLTIFSITYFEIRMPSRTYQKEKKKRNTRSIWKKNNLKPYCGS